MANPLDAAGSPRWDRNFVGGILPGNGGFLLTELKYILLLIERAWRSLDHLESAFHGVPGFCSCPRVSNAIFFVLMPVGQYFLIRGIRKYEQKEAESASQDEGLAHKSCRKGVTQAGGA